MASFEIKRARGKTTVFAGTKQPCDFFVVPTLKELCIQKLLDNANRIECVGDVTHDVLEPLMKQLSLAQLKQIEAYNPHLAEDPGSDKHWEKFCFRYFEKKLLAKHHIESWDKFSKSLNDKLMQRTGETYDSYYMRHNKMRAAGDTWREMFKRCDREREHKLEKIAKRIKRHEEKAIPQRQVKVVENQLSNGKKAIQTVIRKTIKNHIPIRNGHSSNGSSTPSSSSSSSSRPGTTTRTTTVVIRREAGNGSGSKLVKPKTAPLMQKSMQLFKSRFRR